MTGKAQDWVVVGRIGRAHGLRGDVSVEVRTDIPEVRFAPGAQVVTDTDTPEVLTVARSGWHSGRLLVRFDGVVDRTGAEGLRGVLLQVPVGPDEQLDDPDEFFDRQLVGLRVVGPDAVDLGVVAEVLHLPGHDLLAVRSLDGAHAGEGGASEVLVPFVAEIVTDVDLAGGLVRIEPPGGLFEVTTPESESEGP